MTENKEKHCDRDKAKDKANDNEKPHERDREGKEHDSHKDETFGTQRVYKKTSPNCVLTMYLPSREITLVGSTSSILRGIVFVDPKAIQGYRVYAQLTLTFRYGREDEEVMGLRFCNEAIMSLHQVWPRNEEPARESLSPLQDALVKRLGDGAHPFTLTLPPHAPPSVQLVPAKRYYGAPIGTSYDVRCFIADKTDEKFHRRASVKMGVRVIYRADILQTNGLDNLSAVANSSHHQQVASPPSTGCLTTMPPPAHPSTCTSSSSGQHAFTTSSSIQSTQQTVQESAVSNLASSVAGASEPSPTDATSSSGSKSRKSERGESFSKLRLSPKSFRFSSRFGRSKSEIEKCPNDSFYNYSKSFQEYDNLSGGPQGSVDKPFLLQDGRVGLRASLDKAWYTHGEEVYVTVNIRNDSRKTVRKVRVCAIQHVDVCMFNNGKFKNVVADSDSNSPADRTVSPGGTLNTTIVLKPQRGPTKNWIALEDTLQRSTEPDEITGAIAASAIRSPLLLSNIQQAGSSHSNPGSAATHCQQQQLQQSQSYLHHTLHLQPGSAQHHHQQHGDDRNVFAIYVSYYVKVKLTLSGIGGELSLKLPFVLVHVDEEQRQQRELMLAQDATHRLALDDVPVAARKHPSTALKSTVRGETIADDIEENSAEETPQAVHLDRIESMDDENLNTKLSIPIIKSTATTTTTKTNSRMNSSHKRRLIRSETLARDEDDEDAINEVYSSNTPTTTTTNTTTSNTTCSSSLHSMKSGTEVETVHFVQIHNALPEQHMEPEAAIHAAEVASEDS